MKKILALLMALMMLFGAVACSKGGKTTTTKDDPFKIDEETQKLYDTVVLTVNGTDITYEVYRYYYFTLYNNKITENPDYFKKEGALEELRKATLDEITLMVAVKELAKKYKIEATTEQLKEIDEYIKTLKSYLGAGFAETLSKQYTTEKVLRDMLIYEQYSYASLFKYFTSEENEAFDKSDETVLEFMKDYNCAVHILLTKKTYSTKENMEAVASMLEELIALGEASSLAIKENSTAAEAIAELEKFVAKYEESKSKMSYIGGMSVYTNRLLAIKDELGATGDSHPAFAYLASLTEKISGETAISDVKRFAATLKGDGVKESTLTDWSVAYAAYNDMIEKEKAAYSESEEAAWPSVAKQDVLFAMELVGAVLKDHGSENKTNTIKFLDEKLGDVFVETALIFGEDRQDPDVGVYFKKGETNEEFEEAFFALQIGQISKPTYTEFGLHLIKRQQPDLEYFKKNMYNYYAGMKLAEDLADSYKVSYGEIYETITPETIK